MFLLQYLSALAPPPVFSLGARTLFSTVTQKLPKTGSTGRKYADRIASE
jgi:hypothetical protein